MEEINELVEVYKMLNDFLNYIEKEKQQTEKEREEQGE